MAIHPRSPLSVGSPDTGVVLSTSGECVTEQKALPGKARSQTSSPPPPMEKSSNGMRDHVGVEVDVDFGRAEHNRIDH